MTTEEPKLICHVCYNDAFEEAEEDGFFYCLECNSIAENIIQNAADDEDVVGIGGGGIYRRKDTRRIAPPPPPPLDRKPINYDETRDRYVKGFVKMITYQCDALVERFNVTPLIIGLVAPICLRFVSLSGVFDDDRAEKTILDSELRSEGEEVREREVKRRKRGDTAKESYNLYGKRATTIWTSLLKKSLPLSASLAISFLACHKAGSTVLPTDIVRWTKEGKIPYRSCYLKIQESKMFRPFEIVSAQRLEAQAASIADIIGLALPPVNFYGIASNYLKRLCIPKEDKVLDKLVRLIQNWSMPCELYLSKNELKLPTRVCVMSILIVAIRMLYNINGFGFWEESLGLVDDDSESEFDTKELLKNLEAKYYEVADETVEYEKDLSSYLLHGKNEIFAGLAEASADDTYITIDNLWNSQKGSGIFSRKSETRSMDCVSSKEIAIRRLIRDMGENFFSYIPPRVKVVKRGLGGGYLHYVRKREDGALIYAVHADYYILLRVCARVAEIDVRNMHRSVLSFERRLCWIEKRIDQVLHLTPPFFYP